MCVIMRRRILKIVNLPLVYVGVAALCASAALPGNSHSNAMNIASLTLIVAGVAGYVANQKC